MLVGMHQLDSQLCGMFAHALCDRYKGATFIRLEQNHYSEWIGVINWKTNWKVDTLALRIQKEYGGDDVFIVIDGRGGPWGPLPDLRVTDE